MRTDWVANGSPKTNDRDDILEWFYAFPVSPMLTGAGGGPFWSLQVGESGQLSNVCFGRTACARAYNHLLANLTTSPAPRPPPRAPMTLRSQSPTAIKPNPDPTHPSALAFPSPCEHSSQIWSRPHFVHLARRPRTRPACDVKRAHYRCFTGCPHGRALPCRKRLVAVGHTGWGYTQVRRRLADGAGGGIVSIIVTC